MKAKKTIVLALVGSLLLSVFLASGVAMSKTKLSLWCSDSIRFEFFKEAAQAYMEVNPDVEVEPVLFQSRALSTKLATGLPAGAGPDMLSAATLWAYGYQVYGYFDNVPSEIASWMDKNIVEAARTFNRQPGTDEYMNIPWTATAKGIFYNKDHFADAGLAAIPQTIDEETMYAMKLTQYNAAGVVTRAGLSLRKSGGGAGTASKFWAHHLMPYGAWVLEGVTSDGDVVRGKDWTKYSPDDLKWRAGYDNEAGEKALKRMVDLLNKYVVDSYDLKSDAEGFGLGQASMVMREEWVARYMAANAPNVNYSAFLVPKGPATPDGSMNMVTIGLWVPSGGKNKDLAWDFLKWLVNDENAVKQMSNYAQPSLRGNVDFTEAFKIYPVMEVFREGYARPGMLIADTELTAASQEVYTRLAEQAVVYWKGRQLVDNPQGIADAIQSMAEETNRILAENDLLAD